MSDTATERRSALDDFAAQPIEQGGIPATIEPHALAILSRSEIDAQAAVAEHRPRSIKQFRQTVRDLSLVNEDVAAECVYALPGRRNRDGTQSDPIVGPSIRFTEIMAYSWRNARIGARVIDETHDHVTAQGIVSDLETNVVTTFEVRRRIVDARGRRYSADMVNVTANAACSIAKRNAVLGAIPRALWQDIFATVKAVAAGEGDMLAERRERAIAEFQRQGVGLDRLMAAIGVASRDEIGPDQLATLRGILTAIKDGETTIAEAFPQSRPERPATSTLDQFVAASGASSALPEEPGPSFPGQESAGVTGQPPAAKTPADYRDAIDRLLKAATDAAVDADDRAGNIASLQPVYAERFPDDPEFVRDLVLTAIKVAKGEQSERAARKFLEGGLKG
jgi:hypothetical protein